MILEWNYFNQKKSGTCKNQQKEDLLVVHPVNKMAAGRVSILLYNNYLISNVKSTLCRIYVNFLEDFILRKIDIMLILRKK